MAPALPTPAFGPLLMLSGAATARVVASAGPDVVLLDAQHAPFAPEAVAEAIAVFEAAGIPCLVRVGVRDWAGAELALDCGAAGVMFPTVDSVADAERAAAACRFPPRGGRSVGGARSLLGMPVDPEPLCIVQIERADTVALAAEILAVPGVDVVMPGPIDLAASLGAIADYARLGEAMHAADALVAEVEAAAAGAGVTRMRFVMSAQDAAAAAAGGTAIVIVGTDVTALAGGVADVLRAARAGG